MPVLTVEEHSPIGGFNSAVLESASDMGLDTSGIMRVAMPDAWVRQDGRGKQLAETGLDAAGLKRAILTLLERQSLKCQPARELEPKAAPSHAKR